MTEQLWIAPLKRGNLASATTVNSFTTMTQVSPTPDVVIPANTLTPGSAIKVRASGRFGTNGTPTLTFGLYYGGVAGVALSTTAALTTYTTATSAVFVAEFEVDIRTEGATGTAWATGQVAGITSTVHVVQSGPSTAGGNTAVTIDTTGAKSVILAAAFSAQHGLNQVTVDQWDVLG